MADTTFETGTLITAGWLNAVNEKVYRSRLSDDEFAVQTPAAIVGFNYSYDTSELAVVVSAGASTVASGTVTFTTGTLNNKIVKYWTRHEITSITWASANVSDTFVGFPSTLTAGSGIIAIYVAATNIWYRIG